MTFLRANAAFAKVYGRSLMHRLVDGVRRSRLKSATLLVFLFAYLVGGYFLFFRGLNYIRHMPYLGDLLTERIIYLMFFFFFIMLVFSNAVISYISMFRSKETQWLLSLPVPYPALAFWRTIETLTLSSWGLLFMSAPILMAYAKVMEFSPWFFAKSFLLLIPFIAIPACFATWILLLIQRYWRPWMSRLSLGIAGVLLLATVISAFRPHELKDDEKVRDVVATVNRVLKSTEISMHPLLPSSWIAEVILSNGQKLENRGGFYSWLLVSWAAMALVVTRHIGGWHFYAGWNAGWHRGAIRAISRETRAQPRAGDKTDQAARHLALLESAGWRQRRPKLSWLGLSRPTAALIRKDLRTFTREPGQWSQFLLIFVLLLIYVLKLKALGKQDTDPFWNMVVSYLNLGVCALALSTLTTRFIFPQFSMEGQRLWILGLAPFKLANVVWQKFWMSMLFIGTMCALLMLASGLRLTLPWAEIGFFIGGIVSMGFGLTSFAVGIGSIFPDLKETNPARIVSGFGGTLCLIASFIYIVVSISLLALPSILGQMKIRPRGWLWDHVNLNQVLIMHVALTLIGGFALLSLAAHRVRNLDARPH